MSTNGRPSIACPFDSARTTQERSISLITELDRLEFRGKDLKECEDFIAAINKQARAEGKFRDDQWIADLVGASMAGDTLIWWSSLDEEVRGSWMRLRKAMLSRYQLHFAGKSAKEAEDFVHWVRQRALDSGKLNDPIWTAELASGCFVGSALRWYSALDPGIRRDWDSLQQAIFVQYNEGSGEGSSLSPSLSYARIRTVPEPAPAAAAPVAAAPVAVVPVAAALVAAALAASTPAPAAPDPSGGPNPYSERKRIK
ncbi:hypothetical protein FRC01_003015 [Tulasnella sp. 417]|nr:hypothetical protein FRC01_003015 [Tulasnella sp. 417]